MVWQLRAWFTLGSASLVLEHLGDILPEKNRPMFLDRLKMVKTKSMTKVGSPIF